MMVVIELGSAGFILIYIAMAAGIVNVCLLLGLLIAYWKTYKEVKSEFTIGLLYFASFLLLQNIVATIFLGFQLFIPLNFHPSEIHTPRLPLFIINIVQLIALSILFKITLK